MASTNRIQIKANEEKSISLSSTKMIIENISNQPLMWSATSGIKRGHTLNSTDSIAVDFNIYITNNTDKNAVIVVTT